MSKYERATDIGIALIFVNVAIIAVLVALMYWAKLT